MDKCQILYDHYKESNELSQQAKKQRSSYFCGICILEIFNLVFLLYPYEVVTALTGWLDEQYSIVFPLAIPVIQGIIWVLIIYFTVIYFQKNIYIERQYEYLSILETEITQQTGLKCFKRESENYNQNYPLVLTVIDKFYKLGIPIAIIIINSVKIVFEYIHNANWGITIFDSACYIFAFILTILYIKMINFHKEK